MKNKTLILIVLALAVSAGLFLMKDRFSTIRPELKDFAVKDTSSITKIFLANRAGKQVTLERKPGNVWMVNNQYKAKPYQIKNLMDVICRVDVRTPVSKHGYNSVIKQLAANSIKCEIYLSENKEPQKVYYVGGSTEDALGTFMMIEGSSSPFITEIPGFNGYLTPRYSVELNDWRETALFGFSKDKIKSFSVSYRNFPEHSFIMENVNGHFSISAFAEDKKGETVPTDSIAVQNYLDLFRSINVEKWLVNVTQGRKDSVTALPPGIIVKMTLSNDSSVTVKLYPMPLSENSLTQTDEQGNPLKYDLDVMYGIVEPGSVWSTVQHFNIDRILRRLIDFDTRKNKNLKPATPAL